MLERVAVRAGREHYSVVSGFSMLHMQSLCGRPPRRRGWVRFSCMAVVAQTGRSRRLFPAGGLSSMAAFAALAHPFGVPVVHILPGRGMDRVAQVAALDLRRPDVITQFVVLDRAVRIGGLAAQVMAGGALFRACLRSNTMGDEQFGFHGLHGVW